MPSAWNSPRSNRWAFLESSCWKNRQFSEICSCCLITEKIFTELSAKIYRILIAFSITFSNKLYIIACLTATTDCSVWWRSWKIHSFLERAFYMCNIQNNTWFMTKWKSAYFNLLVLYFLISKLNKPCKVSTCCMKSKGCQFKNSFTVTMNCTLWKKWCMHELISDKPNNFSLNMI